MPTKVVPESMPAVVIVLLLLGCSLPALLPGRRQFGAALAVVAVLLVVLAILALQDLEANPGGGDGPAFFALVFLFGVAQVVILASVLGRGLVRWLAQKLSGHARQKAVRGLVVGGMVPLVPLVVLLLLRWADGASGMAVVLAVLVGFPPLWLGAALTLWPGQASMPGRSPW